MNANTEHGVSRAAGGFRPKHTFYHPNSRGTGAALQLELHPASDNAEGCLMAKLAGQLTVGESGGAQPVCARFGWDEAIAIKLGFNDLSKMLQVFRGECESLENGKGLYHRTPRGATRINLRHQIDVVPGFLFECYRSLKSGKESHAAINLTAYEATGLAEAIASSMGLICFGIPLPAGRDGLEGKTATGEQRNAPAA